MQELNCTVQKYAWGKLGENSAVARIKKASDLTFVVSESEPYAEIWMGTHPNGPSKINPSGESLYNWLQEDSSVIGNVPDGYPSNDIPFMFKVLSIKTALSIQAHPDKQFAPILHATQPDIYKDPNHKPEMCVALTSMEAMKGFRPCAQIQQHLTLYPELQGVIGDDAVSSFSSILQTGATEASSEYESRAVEALFGAFLRCPNDRATTYVKAIVDRLSSERSSSNDYLPSLILRLHEDYPGDPGIFCPLILNCLQLVPGEAFFMQANEPHAYIKGDIVEVMALSDNVVRAGLTPKFKDVETMCRMLEYKCVQDLAECLVTPIQVDPFCVLYRPPFDACKEFEIEMVSLPGSEEGAYAVATHPCASILLFVQGANGSYRHATSQEQTPLFDGAVYFLAANCSVSVSSGASPLVFYRAHINLGS